MKTTTLAALHRLDQFSEFTGRVIESPDFDRTVIDSEVSKVAADLVPLIGPADAARSLREAAAGTRSGFAEMRVHESPSISFLIERLLIEAASLEVPTTKN